MPYSSNARGAMVQPMSEALAIETDLAIGCTVLDGSHLAAKWDW